MSEGTGQQQNKRPRGFQALTPERRREIASKGGKAVHAAGTAHEFTSEEDREHMAEIGELGGLAVQQKKRERGEPAFGKMEAADAG